MIKSLAFSLLCLWTISANAFTNKDLDEICDPATETGLACTAYVGGVTDTWRMLNILFGLGCKKLETVSMWEVRTAFQAEYKHLDPEREAIWFLTKYIVKNGGCD